MVRIIEVMASMKDEIIRLNRSRASSRAPSVAGSVKSFRSQRSNGHHFRRNSIPRQQNYRYQRNLYPVWRNYQQYNRRNYNQMLARQRVRYATRFLNMHYSRPMIYRQYQGMNIRWRQPRRRPFQYVNQRLVLPYVYHVNPAPRLAVHPLRQRILSKPSELTVRVENDIFNRQEKTQQVGLVQRKALQRSVGNLNQANLARHNAALPGPVRNVSPNGSTVTAISRKSSRSSRHSRRRRMRNRNRKNNMLVPTSNGLNPEIQHAIAVMQGKVPTEDGVMYVGSVPSSPIGIVLRPSAVATRQSLHNRFSSQTEEPSVSIST